MTVKENTSSNDKPINSDESVVTESNFTERVVTQPNETQANESQIVEDTPQQQAGIPTVDMLTRELVKATKKAAENWELFLRQKAENDNLQKRMERDVEKIHKFGLEKFALELLPIKDSIELGLEAVVKPDTDLNTVREGIELTLKMFNSALERFGIVEIHPQDQKFDPYLHEAMSMQPIPNVEDGTVVYVHQKGYQLNERLLRPARVIIAKMPEDS